MMLRINKDIEVGSFNEEISRINRLNDQFINLNELNKSSNTPIKLRIHNNLPSGMILVDDLSNFTAGLQKIYRKAINFEQIGANKRVRQFIKDVTGLVISEVRPGSFEIDIKQHRSEIAKADINNDFERVTDNVTKLSLTTLSEILEKIYDEDFKEIIDEYGIETLKVSHDWFEKIQKSTTSFELDSQNNHIDFTERKIYEINDTLKKLNIIKVDDIRIEGILTAINHKKSTLAITSDTDETTVIKVQDKNFKISSVTSNKKYNILAKHQEVTIENNVISSEYYIEDLSNIEYTD